MAKNHGDLIREHGEAIATLNQRITDATRDADRLENSFVDSSKALRELETRLAVLERRFDEWKKTTEESDRRRWTIIGIGVAVLAVVVNVIISLTRR